MTVFNRCREQAVTGAIAQINLSALTRYHEEQIPPSMLLVRR